jgi:type II secretory ATPase GspE/PulE/Tfp pilus assembly ATPase PilB-like protein
MGIEPYLLAGSINLIIAQRLVRRVCSTCKGTGVMPGQTVGATPDKKTACQTCLGNGYQGRLPIVEALKPSEEFNELIGRKATIDEFERKARALGMESMLEDGMTKVAAGLTTEAEVERVTREAN